MKALVEKTLIPFAPRTFAAYSGHFDRFRRFCDEHRVATMPVESAVLRDYLLSHARSKAWLSQFQASVFIACRAKGYKSPFDDPKMRLFLRSLRRNLPDVRKQATPLKNDDWERIVACSDRGSPRSHRDLAIVGLMRDCLLRSSELRALNVGDIGGNLCHIARSKSDQDGKGAWLYISDTTLEYVDLWLSWLDVDDGALFRPLTRANRLIDRRLGINAVKRILDRLCRKSGIEKSLTSHSMRVGMAQDLAEDGETLLNIQVVGRWKSPTMPAYYCRKQSAMKSATHAYHARRKKAKQEED